MVSVTPTLDSFEHGVDISTPIGSRMNLHDIALEEDNIVVNYSSIIGSIEGASAVALAKGSFARAGMCRSLPLDAMGLRFRDRAGVPETLKVRLQIPFSPASN